MAAVIAAVGGYVYLANTHLNPVPAPQPAAPTQTPAPAPTPTPTPAPSESGPQFDVLRVDSAGNTVLAGRGAPGARISIQDGGKVIGTVTADASGQFVFIPAAPLPPGAQQLTLSETLPDGRTLQGETSASVEVAANPSGQSLAVISGPNGSRIVSGQGPVPGTLGIGTVDYDANGHAIFSGTAPAGDHVLLSLNGQPLGSAVAGPDGRWHLIAKVPASSGTLQLVDGSRPDRAPLLAPFALKTLKAALAEGDIIIAPGQNLWLIARHVYGRGILYTVIYSANSGKIHDPNLIFPGQDFTLPNR
jgi:nucleoid-associated protein YgaU